MEHNKILAVDPSGTGTTGIYYQNGTQEQFKQYTGKEWVEHYRFILSLVRAWQPYYLLFENSNYVSLRGKDMTYLWKLLGAIEVLPYEFPIYLQTKDIPVNQVKGLRSKLLKGKAQITGLEYRPGKGWYYSGKKISTHELDAYLVYWLWNNKQNKELIGESIEKAKIKPNIKTKDHKKETILKIDGKEYSLIWEPKYTNSERAYYCPELNFYFQRMVSGNYKIYKPHECERECPTSPCSGCGEYGYIEEPEELCGEDFELSEDDIKDHD